MRRGTSGINAVIAVDKPLGMTSHDVVNRVRRALGERRVGHAGTLDPDASGVMVVGIGQGTRLMGLMTADDKRYDALVEFGSETNTDDAEGEVTREALVPDRLAQPEVAQVVVASLVGEVDQVPPAFSAISVNGVRSYQRARDGEDFELEPGTFARVGAAEKRKLITGDEPARILAMGAMPGKVYEPPEFTYEGSSAPPLKKLLDHKTPA